MLKPKISNYGLWMTTTSLYALFPKLNLTPRANLFNFWLDGHTAPKDMVPKTMKKGSKKIKRTNQAVDAGAVLIDMS